MNKFIGTKIVKAEPMTRAAYNEFRGWQLPADENGSDEGYLVEYTDGGKPNVPGREGYVSWSPKEQFDRAYRPLAEGEKLPFNLESSIIAFNNMYGLPVSPVPVLINSKRLKDLKAILLKEISEVDDIIRKMENLEMMYKLQGQHAMEQDQVSWANQAEQELEVLGDLADWLGDIQVYAQSEMAKWGLPILATLEIIMQSNMSKLGADGLPIVDDTGKVGKGPNYWKPEPKLREMLAANIIRWRVARHAELQGQLRESILRADAAE